MLLMMIVIILDFVSWITFSKLIILLPYSEHFSCVENCWEINLWVFFSSVLIENFYFYRIRNSKLLKTFSPNFFFEERNQRARILAIELSMTFSSHPIITDRSVWWRRNHSTVSISMWEEGAPNPIKVLDNTTFPIAPISSK